MPSLGDFHTMLAAMGAMNDSIVHVKCVLAVMLQRKATLEREGRATQGCTPSKMFQLHAINLRFLTNLTLF